MFGRRADGRRLDNIDPIIQFAPYIMKTRNDAMNYITEYVDFQPLADYIRRRTKEGRRVSFMAIIMAAYVQTVAKYPELNRFVMNKQIFARNEIVASLTVLKKPDDPENLDEALAKMRFKPDSTLDEVDAEIARQTAEVVKPDADSGTAAFAAKLVKARLFVQMLVLLCRVLDRYGLLPKALYDLSPFHCSMYLTNMASVNMTAVYHHLYNFGNTSVFIALGKYEKQLVKQKNGEIEMRAVLPLKITVDERICGGATFALGVQYFLGLLRDPERLEKPAPYIRTEIPEKRRAAK